MQEKSRDVRLANKPDLRENELHPNFCYPNADHSGTREIRIPNVGLMPQAWV
jgi:hypothetical protein